MHTNALPSFAFATPKTEDKTVAIQTQAKIIPVLDFSNLELKPRTSSWLSSRKDVCRALEEYSYFVAELGNKIPLELHNKMFSSVGELESSLWKPKGKSLGYFSTAPFERMLIDNATSTEEAHKLTNIFWPNGNDHVR